MNLLTPILFLVSWLITPPTGSHDANRLAVPLGGNAWVSNSPDRSTKITNDGLTGWSASESVVSTYVRFDRAGTLKLSATLSVPEGESKIRVSLPGKSAEFSASGSAEKEYFLGEWTIQKPGYVKIDIQGLTKSGTTFGQLRELGISGDVIDEKTAFVRNNQGNYFHWGRRGPSVHLKYTTPDNTDSEWFYNEITVPEGNDVLGSYFMATGFAEGYFGMQVNSPTERRILFSVWSPFKTDNPKEIPDDQKILLEKKGEGVTTNDFGNEGSGGQSYLRYNWKAGRTYRFLLRGRPTENGYTTYTAYFSDSEDKDWQLIASFKRPKTTTYLKSFHSFLENFMPNTGNTTRQVTFGNQWVRSKEGNWQEIVNAKFTGDATARAGFRQDYAGGLNANEKQFFLKNCGFFDDNVLLNTDFTRKPLKKAPSIDFSRLP
ncbi:DUF3472 domain-containing protein [Larkinella terrae]|uniref:DUF5077 domain-containing protein n=1 Tax=Larkinella terrae TaxID=2025311 RepID=A0A7K0ENP0_9BACT|nr:DUF3472 domain-containing protein [Larkinella terrae]MRS63450.1 DUF5077 domain-containing protein [Larkinella terrae]